MPRDFELEHQGLPVHRNPATPLPVVKERPVDAETDRAVSRWLGGLASKMNDDDVSRAREIIQARIGETPPPREVQPASRAPFVSQNFIEAARKTLRGTGFEGRGLLAEWGNDDSNFAYARSGGEDFERHFPNLTAELTEDDGNNAQMIRLFATAARSRDLCPGPH